MSFIINNNNSNNNNNNIHNSLTLEESQAGLHDWLGFDEVTFITDGRHRHSHDECDATVESSAFSPIFNDYSDNQDQRIDGSNSTVFDLPSRIGSNGTNSCNSSGDTEDSLFLPHGADLAETFEGDNETLSKQEEQQHQQNDHSGLFDVTNAANQEDAIASVYHKLISDLSFNDRLIQQIHQLQQHLLLLKHQQQQQPQQQQNVPPQQQQQEQQQVPTKNPHTTSTFTSAAAPSSDINICDDYTMLEGNRPHSDPWVTRYQELQEFQAQFGHTIVPHNYTKSSSLAQWVKRQRNQRKRKLRGDNSCLTNVRELALDRLGFVWDAHAVSWEEHFNDLLDFKRKNGHCNVSSSYSENPKLSVWVKSQRRHYRLWEKGDTRSSMTRARFDRLNDIGFNWNPRNV